MPFGPPTRLHQRLYAGKLAPAKNDVEGLFLESVGPGHQGRALLVIVGPTVMAAATLGPEALKFGGDGLRFIREEPGKTQVAEGLEEGALLVGELHASAPIGKAAAHGKCRWCRRVRAFRR